LEKLLLKTRGLLRKLLCDQNRNASQGLARIGIEEPLVGQGTRYVRLPCRPRPEDIQRFVRRSESEGLKETERMLGIHRI
jgi:hypothetical protein